MRDVKHLNEVYFIDIDWMNYDFEKHLWAVKSRSPALTVARDIETSEHLDAIIREAEELSRHARTVILVPKDRKLEPERRLGVPFLFRLGYSVPTKYGGTEIPVQKFVGEVHLLGGRPDVQRALAQDMNVVSLDGNRVTLDAKFGDMFVGDRFRPHPVGGYGRAWTHRPTLLSLSEFFPICPPQACFGFVGDSAIIVMKRTVTSERTLRVSRSTPPVSPMAPVIRSIRPHLPQP